MTRLRHRKDWFYQLSPSSIPEAQFESLLVQNVEMLRTSCWLVPFKKTVYSRDGSARADLAIIDFDYREWFVVEVELSTHDLYDHVLPQVRTLRDGHYGLDHADYIVDRLPVLDAVRTRQLIRGSSPRIAVIADRSKRMWADVLKGADIDLITLEIYKSDLNKYIFAIDGGLPLRAADLISYCSFSSMLPRQIMIETPGGLPIQAGERIRILLDGQIVEWIRMDAGDRCYLRTRGSVDLRQGVKYALLMQSDQTLVLKPSARGDL